MTLMPRDQSKRLPARISLLAIGATALFAGCGSEDPAQSELESPKRRMCSAGGCWDDWSGSGGAGGGGGAVCEQTGCVDGGENMFCAPNGFPFVTRAFSVTESCVGPGCLPPGPALTQPETGTLCLSGTAPVGEEAGFPLILFTSSPDFGQIVEPFDAIALGITHLSFTLDSVPEGGVLVDAGIVATRDCSVSFGCLGLGFMAPRITDAGPVTIPLADFQQIDPERPEQDFDASSLSHIGFTVGPGPYDFCLSDLQFLDANGDPVEPAAGPSTAVGECHEPPASGAGGTGGTGGASFPTWGATEAGRPCTADVTDLAPSDGFLTTFMGDDGLTSRLRAIPSDSPSAPEISTEDGALHIAMNTEATSMLQYPGVVFGFGSLDQPRCIDASAFSGVEFSIKGSLSGCSLRYATADVAHQDSSGTRSSYATGPAGSYAPFAIIPSAELTAEPQVLKMPFVGGPSDGSPPAPVDPTKLIFLTWLFEIALAVDDEPDACVADITVDDVKFY
jgi:hypothetical protein